MILVIKKLFQWLKFLTSKSAPKKCPNAYIFKLLDGALNAYPITIIFFIRNTNIHTSVHSKFHIDWSISWQVTEQNVLKL